MSRRLPLPLFALACVAAVFGVYGTVTARAAEACGPGIEAIRVGAEVLCTHGNDEPPPGVDTETLPTTEELFEARFATADPEVAATEAVEESDGGVTVAAAGTVACIGDGVSGARVQLVYARASDVASRYGSVLPLLRQYASDADDIINVSAGRVGDGRRVRYVTNSSCEPTVLNVQLTKTGDDSFGNMLSELKAMGLNSKDRKYLVFMDAAVGICGLGEVYLNDRPDELNPNNTGAAMFSRVDTSCWQYAAAHELLHTLGAVQNSAPNSTGYGHCTDEVDVMCYRDHSTTVTKQVCSRAGQVDCNNNDYFHPNPSSTSYLAKKWNVARSRYLADTAPPPLPPTTLVTVPSSGLAGVPWPVRVDIATAGATVTWSSTRSDCWFGDAKQAVTSWTCPATATGEAQLTVHVTESGITTPYDQTVALQQPETKLSLSVATSPAKRTIAPGETRTLTTRFNAMSSGADVAGLPVILERRDKGSTTWRVIAKATTNRNGIVRFDVAPPRNRSFKVRSTRNHTWSGTRSNVVPIAVKSKLTTRVNSKMIAGMSMTSVPNNREIVVGGKIGPNKAGKTIKLRRYYNGRWRTIRSKQLNADSKFRFSYTPKTKGTLKLRVVKPADNRNLGVRKVLRFSVG